MPKKKVLQKSAKSASRAATPPKAIAEPVSRKEPYGSERLRSVVERLREQSMRLAGLARGMDDAKVESMVVDGHAMLVRGLNQIDNFIDNGVRAVREAKQQRTSL